MPVPSKPTRQAQAPASCDERDGHEPRPAAASRRQRSRAGRAPPRRGGARRRRGDEAERGGPRPRQIAGEGDLARARLDCPPPRRSAVLRRRRAAKPQEGQERQGQARLDATKGGKKDKKLAQDTRAASEEIVPGPSGSPGSTSSATAVPPPGTWRRFCAQRVPLPTSRPWSARRTAACRPARACTAGASAASARPSTGSGRPRSRR